MKKIIKKFFRYYFASKEQIEFEELCKKNRINDSAVKGTILIDCSHMVYPKWSLKHFLVMRAKAKQGFNFHAFYPAKIYLWLSPKIVVLWLMQIIYNREMKTISSMGFKRVVGLPSVGVFDVFQSFLEAKKIWKELGSKKDVLEISVDGICFGDLIYDTYLKWFKVPTVSISSPKLLFVLFLFFLYQKKILIKLETFDYKEIYLTHSVYLAFGVLARHALARGIDVYVIQNVRSGFYKKLSPTDPLQTPYFDDYKNIIKGLPDNDRKKLTSEARLKLEGRLNGVVDESIYYMRKSAYERDNISGINFKELDRYPGEPRILIFLHCFFDSPHIYRWMIFEDFYEWLCYSVSYLLGKRVNVYLKKHPNALSGNERVIKDLSRKFNDAIFLEDNVNNSTLVKDGEFLGALTVYGTVAHELAYQHILCVNAGDNPHVSFGFCASPKDIESYNIALDSLISGDKQEIDVAEVLDFYAAHYLLDQGLNSPVWNEFIERTLKTESTYPEVMEKLDEEVFNKLEVEVLGITRMAEV